MASPTANARTWPIGSIVQVTKMPISWTSSRKRLTASPGEAGSARAPGRSRMRSSALRRTRVFATRTIADSVMPPTIATTARATATMPSSTSRLWAFQPAGAWPVRVSRIWRITSPGSSGSR